MCFPKSSGVELLDFASEFCFAVEWEDELPDRTKLDWLLGETWEPELLASTSFLTSTSATSAQASAFATPHTPHHELLVEYGPRLSFSTAWSTNAAQICRAAGLKVKRIERSRRLKLVTSTPITTDTHKSALEKLHNMLHDRMTEMIYSKSFPQLVVESLTNFTPVDWTIVDVLAEGRSALEKVNSELGLAFDSFDLDYYTRLFVEDLQRNPTSVELFDLSQSNSEHSRHWFFKGKMVLNGDEKKFTLMELVTMTLQAHQTNSTLALCDNASAIRGREVLAFTPKDTTRAGPVSPVSADYDITFTAETHNFPTGIAPFPGAETGTGGRLRDTQAAGRGSLVLAGTTGYSVGQLQIPGYYLPWEDRSFTYPSNMARPLQIILEASSGASDYANKFGEPLVVGFARSFGALVGDHRHERREYIKPIMFTGGLGQIDHTHLKKEAPEMGMKIIKIGGPAYRIGLGGGAASSMVQGDNKEHLDFNAVQRGDAEMEQKLYRVVRACVELGAKNPIISIHDQGAGGNANVLKELVEPEGGIIRVRDIPCGDFTLSALEIWSAEYQENNALLIRAESEDLFRSICERESCVWAIVGDVTGDGKVVLFDSQVNRNAFDLPLSAVLGKMPQKTFTSDRFQSLGTRLRIPKSVNMETLLNRVLRNLSVGSKRFLTTKIDRSVTGLVAQQPCVGPLHIPLADYGVTVQSYFGKSGMATSIGEQPIIGLLNPEAMGRMTVGEALTNIVFAYTEPREYIKASGNWMWPAKLEGEADAMYRTCHAMSEIMIQLGVAIDGGKDSLSMAAKSGTQGEIVKAPGTLVVSLYAAMEDVHKKICPAIRRPGESSLVFIDLGLGKQRTGGSILAQSFAQLGFETPDLDNPVIFAAAFDKIRALLKEGKLLAGHDRSDGGLITTILEMAFAGDCGFNIAAPTAYCNIHLPYAKFIYKSWFNEELGLVVEVLDDDLNGVLHDLRSVPGLEEHVHLLGRTTVEKRLVIGYYGETVAESESILDEATEHLRDVWESTSFELEMHQANTLCVRQEQVGLKERVKPAYKLSFTPAVTPASVLEAPVSSKPKVAIVREEGSNGDREMAAAFHLAGFEAWDVNMKDLISGAITLDSFQGVAFVGGFSYADVMDSAKGWAGTIRFNEQLLAQFDRFINQRTDTFSLGICNGCQLMALLGYVPFPQRKLASKAQPRFTHNTSGRFESRFSTVSILESPAIMFKEMVGTTMGIWVSHGEGRAYFPDQAVFQETMESNLAPLRYANDLGEPTEDYPFNPNGSPFGIAALCSEDGRHLAMMPHSERTSFTWNWPWMPEEWREANHPANTVSPWLKMFQNAYTWCTEQSKKSQ